MTAPAWTSLSSKTRARALIEAIRTALENMDKKYCKLSTLNYEDTDFHFREILEKAKYLERPFAYEFYHQLRLLIENNCVNFGEAIVQAEVDKRYQQIPEVEDIPDFIIHLPDSLKNNVAVIELKLASRKRGDIEDDLDKLVGFQGPDLRYDHIVEVLIGSKKELELRRKPLLKKIRSLGVPITTIVEFNVETWRVIE